MVIKSYPLIETRNLTKEYSRRNCLLIKALDGIDLKMMAGEFVAIVGRSGSGKTTLLNLVGALDRPTSGEVSNRDLALLRRRKIGFIFQTFDLLPALTARENIELALFHHRMSQTQRNQKVVDLMDSLELSNKMNSLPLELSVGQQQRVAIARALVKEPLVILADEPTGEMDPITGKEIVRKLIELNRKSKVTLIVASHGSFPFDKADRTLFIKNGKLVSRKESGYSD